MSNEKISVAINRIVSFKLGCKDNKQLQTQTIAFCHLGGNLLGNGREDKRCANV